MKYYAGIGSRNIQNEPEIMENLTSVARYMSSLRYRLRSGHAVGADSAFYLGSGGNASISLPWPSFGNILPKLPGTKYYVPSGDILYKATLMASCIHPAWNKLSSAGKLLQARNMCQIFGADLNTPVDFVLYAADVDTFGEVTGGTRTGVVAAEQAGIPTFNLLNEDEYIAFNMYELR